MKHPDKSRYVFVILQYCNSSNIGHDSLLRSTWEVFRSFVTDYHKVISGLQYYFNEGWTTTRCNLSHPMKLMMMMTTTSDPLDAIYPTQSRPIPPISTVLLHQTYNHNISQLQLTAFKNHSSQDSSNNKISIVSPYSLNEGWVKLKGDKKLLETKQNIECWWYEVRW